MAEKTILWVEDGCAAKPILWVEDENDQFTIYKNYYGKYKLNIIQAIDYIDAMDKFEHIKIDLCIVDLIIPSGKKYYDQKSFFKDKNKYYGIELIEQIRNKNKKIPIIVVSVVNEDQIISKILQIDPNIKIFWKYAPDSEMEIGKEINLYLKRD